MRAAAPQLGSRESSPAARSVVQVRKYITSIAKPGIRLFDMCECLEDSVRNLIEAKGLDAGIAFPTGCSLDYVAAHWTPNGGDKTVLTYDNVMKLGALPLCCPTAASPRQLDLCRIAARPVIQCQKCCKVFNVQGHPSAVQYMPVHA